MGLLHRVRGPDDAESQRREYAAQEAQGDARVGRRGGHIVFSTLIVLLLYYSYIYIVAVLVLVAS